MIVDEVIAAGCLLVKAVPRPSWASADLLPDRLVSASTCICPRFPGTYALSWCGDSIADRAAAFEEIGVEPARRADAIEWATAEFERTFGWPGIFYTIDAAREARARFLANGDIAIVGLGLPHRYRKAFVERATPPLAPDGCAPHGKSACLDLIEAGGTMSAGVVLGYEPLNLQMWQPGCSWLCNGLERFAATELGIHPNACGFLGSLDDAVRCCDAIQRADVGAEPGPWFPWLIVDYSGNRPTNE